MASQRVILLAIGGLMAEKAWEDICRWSDARTATTNDEWSSDDWPIAIANEIDAFAEEIASSGFTPPILYRSEYVDCYSMGDVYEGALEKTHPEHCRKLFTTTHEVISTWVRHTERITPNRHAGQETLWLYNRVNEAIDAWGELAERRLIILMRCVLGGLWTDEEVADSLKSITPWGENQEQADGSQ